MSADHLSYNVRFWRIETRGRATPSYRVRWVVAGHRHDESFVKSGLAESFRAQLMAAASKGEGFDVDTGLPQSLLRKRRDVSFLCHCQEFVAAAWKDAAAKSRVSILEALSVAVPVLTRDLAGSPDPDVLRHALRKALNQNEHARRPDEEERRALEWLERASLPVSALNDGAVVSDMLDVLAKCLDGSTAAPDYFARRRRVMHRVLAYAVRKKRLGLNPLSKGNLPEGWSPPGKPQEAVDPRSVGSPELVAGMLVATSYVGRRQGPRFVAFFGCMFYAMMRPAEVISLTEDGCVLPENGWGLADLLRLQPGSREGVHRRRPRARGPRAERTRPPRAGADAVRPGPPGNPQRPHPARARDAAARAHLPLRHRAGRAPVPQRER